MDTLTKAQRSARMRRIRSKDTAPELALRRLVWSLGYRYRTNRRDVPGNPDLTFIGRRRAIFLHGCFWHRHRCTMGQRTPKSRIKFWLDKFDRNVARDKVVMRELRSCGWRSMVVWECELRNAARVEKRVKAFLDA
jgi:DNA mismatch endonuclease (patch repair protein)